MDVGEDSRFLGWLSGCAAGQVKLRRRPAFISGVKIEAQAPLAPVVEIVFPRWKAQVLWVLLTRGQLRFGEIARELPRIAPSMLTLRLKELEAEGFVVRTSFAESPPRVEYSVTDLGRSLKPIFDRLLDWSARHLDTVTENRHNHDRRL